MAEIVLLNKPFNVLSQFTDKEGRSTLADYISDQHFYPAGRLDYDSEGLLALVNDGRLQARIADPKHKLVKTYWAQVEGTITEDAITQLQKGVILKDGPTKPAKARVLIDPEVWARVPPVRERKSIPTSWLELSISEGRNRQVRRMTAHVGFPTLRLIRVAIGNWKLGTLQPGESRRESVHLPAHSNAAKRPTHKKTSNRRVSHKRGKTKP